MLRPSCACGEGASPKGARRKCVWLWRLNMPLLLPRGLLVEPPHHIFRHQTIRERANDCREPNKYVYSATCCFRDPMQTARHIWFPAIWQTQETRESLETAKLSPSREVVRSRRDLNPVATKSQLKALMKSTITPLENWWSPVEAMATSKKTIQCKNWRAKL